MEKTTNNKKEVKKECCSKFHDDFKKHCKKMGSLLKDAKVKFDKADDKTKKAVVAGLAGAAAMIAGTIGYHKIKGKKKK